MAFNLRLVPAKAGQRFHAAVIDYWLPPLAVLVASWTRSLLVGRNPAGQPSEQHAQLLGCRLSWPFRLESPSPHRTLYLGQA